MDGDGSIASFVGKRNGLSDSLGQGLGEEFVEVGATGGRGNLEQGASIGVGGYEVIERDDWVLSIQGLGESRDGFSLGDGWNVGLIVGWGVFLLHLFGGGRCRGLVDLRDGDDALGGGGGLGYLIPAVGGKKGQSDTKRQPGDGAYAIGREGGWPLD